MTRVWSMASERTDHQDCAQIQESIVLRCVGQLSSTPPAPPPPPPLPPDNDSGYEASPSSATRMTSFQFGSVGNTTIDTTVDDELLSIDLFFAPIMLYGNEDDMDGDEGVSDDDEDLRNEFEDSLNRRRAESRNSGDSNGSDRSISTPIPIPIPTTSRMTYSSHENLISQRSLTEHSTPSPLSLGQTDMGLGPNRTGFRHNYYDEGFRRGAMFARHNWNRYHVGIDAISPQSPPTSTYWSPYLIGIVSPGRHPNNNNHYMGIDESVTSAQSLLSFAQDIRLPSPLSSLSFSTQMHSRNVTESYPLNESQENANNYQPLPDVVNFEPTRMRTTNGHSQARRAVSVSLPIDADTIRSVGMSLRRISEEFAVSNSRMMLSESESQGMVGNIFASVRLSRRSLSSRFRSHHFNLNGRQRSFSTNDAPEE